MVDPLLGQEYDERELQILCDVARSCVQVGEIRQASQ